MFTSLEKTRAAPVNDNVLCDTSIWFETAFQNIDSRILDKLLKFIRLFKMMEGTVLLLYIEDPVLFS